jgi:hypothetical protein
METMSWDNLKGAEVGPFRPTPHYDPDSDTLSLFVSDDESYRERIDKLLTVYRSFRTREVVGCHVKHVRRILDTVHMFKLGIESRRIKIGLLLLGLPLASGASGLIFEGRNYEEIIRPITEHAGAEEITVPA